MDNFVDKTVDNSLALPQTAAESQSFPRTDKPVRGGYSRKRPQLPPDELVPITRLMEDLSVEFGDRDHTQSNISQAMNLMVQVGLNATEFFRIAYDVRTSVRQLTNARNRMAVFFSMLRRELRVDKVCTSPAKPEPERRVGEAGLVS